MILACGSEIVAKSKVSTCRDIVVDKQTGHVALHSFLKFLFIFGISFESQPFTHTSQIEMQQGASASRCHRPVDVRRLSNPVCESSRTVARPPSTTSSPYDSSDSSQQLIECSNIMLAPRPARSMINCQNRMSRTWFFCGFQRSYCKCIYRWDLFYYLKIFSFIVLFENRRAFTVHAIVARFFVNGKNAQIRFLAMNFRLFPVLRAYLIFTAPYKF
jgi:hypothetical protein